MRLAHFEFDGRQHEGTIREDGDIETEARTYELTDVNILPPCNPTKVIAVGKNYVNHVKEMAERHDEEPVMPEFPFFFLKPPSSVIGPGDPIVFPDEAQQVDYEGELGVVIDRRCRKVPPEDVSDYIKGYTCVNDVSWRDWASRENQWFRHKGPDTFCPIGPFIQTTASGHVQVETRVNGEVRQSSSTSDMVFSVEELISEASQYVTLEPGDVVATGTPSGVGPLQPGDVVEVDVETVGTLENRVASEQSG